MYPTPLWAWIRFLSVICFNFFFIFFINVVMAYSEYLSKTFSFHISSAILSKVTNLFLFLINKFKTFFSDLVKFSGFTTSNFEEAPNFSRYIALSSASLPANSVSRIFNKPFLFGKKIF